MRTLVLFFLFAAASVQASSVYDQILSEFGTDYDEIGKKIAEQVLKTEEGSFSKLGLNQIGFGHNKEFGGFEVKLSRRILPNLFRSGGYTVKDTFEIHISASKLSDHLTNNGDGEEVSAELKSFKNLVFVRRFKFHHSADTYEQALFSDFRKLFLPFVTYRDLSLKSGESLESSDYISIDGFISGFKASSNSFVSIEVGGGAKLQFEKLSKILLFADHHNSLYASAAHESSRSLDLIIKAGVSFFKLINMNFLDISVKTGFRKGNVVNFKFDQAERESIPRSFLSTLKRISKGRSGNLRSFVSNVTSKDELVEKYIKTNLKFLHSSKEKRRSTEMTDTIIEGKRDRTFKHTFFSRKEKKSFWGFIINEISRSLLNYSTGTKTEFVEKKAMEFSYKSHTDLIKNKEKIDQDDFKMNLAFDTQVLVNKNKKKYKSFIKSYLKYFSFVNPEIIELIKRKRLRIPASFNILFSISDFSFFLDISSEKMISNIKKLCSFKSGSRLYNFRSSFSHCKHKLITKFYNFKLEHNHNRFTGRSYKRCKSRVRRGRDSFRKIRACQKMIAKIPADNNKPLPLWRVAEFWEELYLNVKTINHLRYFFGSDLIEISGKTELSGPSGRNYITIF